MMMVWLSVYVKYFVLLYVMMSYLQNIITSVIHRSTFLIKMVNFVVDDYDL